MFHFEHTLSHSEMTVFVNHFNPPNTRRDVVNVLTVPFPIFPTSQSSHLGLSVKAASPIHLVHLLDLSAIHQSDTKSL